MFFILLAIDFLLMIAGGLLTYHDEKVYGIGLIVLGVVGLIATLIYYENRHRYLSRNGCDDCTPAFIALPDCGDCGKVSHKMDCDGPGDCNCD